MRQEQIVGRCAKCNRDSDEAKLHLMNRAYICDDCFELSSRGRDATTRGARALKVAMTEQATANLCQFQGDLDGAASHQSGANEYAQKSDQLLQAKPQYQLASGEAVQSAHSGIITDTLKAPGVAALDASAHRIDLLSQLGNDCVALAIDASDSIKADNSLEKMLAHQLAVAHKTALEITNKSLFESDVVAKSRLLNMAARFMDVFQRGLLTLQRLRTGGEQRITIHRVDVGEGGQAIVGGVQTGGTKTK
jgi:hypothetical protein